MAADLHRDGFRARRVRRRHFVERALAVGVEMGDRARADIADERHLAARRRRPAAADEAGRLDAEIGGGDGDFVGAQTARAVEQVGDGGGRAPERLGEAAARLAGFLQGVTNPIDGHAPMYSAFQKACNHENQKIP